MYCLNKGIKRLKKLYEINLGEWIWINFKAKYAQLKRILQTNKEDIILNENFVVFKVFLFMFIKK